MFRQRPWRPTPPPPPRADPATTNHHHVEPTVLGKLYPAAVNRQHLQRSRRGRWPHDLFPRQRSGRLHRNHNCRRRWPAGRPAYAARASTSTPLKELPRTTPTTRRRRRRLPRRRDHDDGRTDSAEGVDCEGRAVYNVLAKRNFLCGQQHLGRRVRAARRRLHGWWEPQTRALIRAHLARIVKGGNTTTTLEAGMHVGDHLLPLAASFPSLRFVGVDPLQKCEFVASYGCGTTGHECESLPQRVGC